MFTTKAATAANEVLGCPGEGGWERKEAEWGEGNVPTKEAIVRCDTIPLGIPLRAAHTFYRWELQATMRI